LQRVVVRTIQELLGMFRRQELPIVFTELGSRAADGRDLPPFRRALLAGRDPKTGRAVSFGSLRCDMVCACYASETV
jgi:hypothetical protein